MSKLLGVAIPDSSGTSDRVKNWNILDNGLRFLSAQEASAAQAEVVVYFLNPAAENPWFFGEFKVE